MSKFHWIALIAGLAVVLGLTAACGGDGPSLQERAAGADESGSTDTTEEQEAEEAEEQDAVCQTEDRPAARSGGRYRCEEGEWVFMENPTTTTAPLVAPTAADFTLSLITQSSQCFGSAGCVVTVVPQLAYVGAGPYDWPDTVSITYQIDGDDSGPIIDTVQLTPDGNYGQRGKVLSTVSAEVVPTITVTAVR